MAKNHHLRNVHALLVDNDSVLAQATMHNMRAMGFEHIYHVRNGAMAQNMMLARPVHFIITEWDMPQMDGMTLVSRLRQDVKSPHRSLPVLMLTGRSEQADILAVRDAGINEYLTKPFSANSLFQRLQQIVDYPRAFVISSNFTGPTRRRKEENFGASRRKVLPARTTLREAAMEDAATPKIIMPDFSIRHTIGANDPLASMITADTLKQAQSALDALREGGKAALLEDLTLLETAFLRLNKGYSHLAVEHIKDASLSIKSRAGMMGCPMASSVARLLYLFICGKYLPNFSRHDMIIGRHIAALKLVIAQHVAENDRAAQELLFELERLAAVA
jgi:DNA-binding response OmpR family regulator